MSNKHRIDQSSITTTTFTLFVKFQSYQFVSICTHKQHKSIDALVMLIKYYWHDLSMTLSILLLCILYNSLTHLLR